MCHFGGDGGGGETHCVDDYISMNIYEYRGKSKQRQSNIFINQIIDFWVRGGKYSHK